MRHVFALVADFSPLLPSDPGWSALVSSLSFDLLTALRPEVAVRPAAWSALSLEVTLTVGVLISTPPTRPLS